MQPRLRAWGAYCNPNSLQRASAALAADRLPSAICAFRTGGGRREVQRVDPPLVDQTDRRTHRRERGPPERHGVVAVDLCDFVGVDM